MPQGESVLLTVIVQLIVIIAATRIFGAIFRRYLGQPQVCGGIAVGPSAGPCFSVLSQIGLVQESKHNKETT